ncbi:hypothetical protein HanXRQr2_Chr09g0367051 [Helianthus annuus]|uniref:Uncharacterized protein n=1 Tax=Helianthus annuus TaxID=4232 RepID=A0A9K3N7D4_HELAN|nr:hypothetical protein HanXRQr2_Chr09g0367051 [Helianthus annuus]KAJ0532319.1 hypothetical protein HanIR_Chr09g0395421 [Helianthus annuus]KAJ0891423.1 hypothetical protein HanPSC8_Chr09g0353581 [Helianthus annuus]
MIAQHSSHLSLLFLLRFSLSTDHTIKYPDLNSSLSLSPLTNLFSPSHSSTRPRALVHNAGWRCNPDSIADLRSYTTTRVLYRSVTGKISLCFWVVADKYGTRITISTLAAVDLMSPSQIWYMHCGKTG